MVFSSSDDENDDLEGKKEFINTFDNSNKTAKKSSEDKGISVVEEDEELLKKAFVDEKDEDLEESKQAGSKDEQPKKKTKWGLDIPKSKKSQVSSKDDKLPLLLRNRIVRPDEFKDEAEGFQKDLNRRPDEPTMENYSKTPVSRFGEEMMKIMGWKGAAGAGCASKKETKAIQYIPRPERLGLGASVARDVSDLRSRKPVEVSLGLEMTKDEEKQLKRISEPKRKVDLEILASHSNYIGADEALTGIKKIRLDLDVGSKISIISGEHAGLAGIIKNSSKDGSCWLIELKINNQNVMIPKSAVKRFDQETSKKPVEEFNSRHSHLWACSGLKVKLKSKSFMNGKYYNIKGIIIDVHPDQTCTIRLIDSSSISSSGSGTNLVVQKVPQNILETCLPRSANPSRPTVKYLRRDRGEAHFLAPFRILQFDDKRGLAIIQADDDLETCFETHYDDICEYIN